MAADLFGGDTPQRNTKLSRIRDYSLRHPVRAAESQREWRARNPLTIRAHKVSRKRRFAKATPKWVDRAALRQFYANRPEGHHVDHIIPLKGVTPEGYPVSGLHVPWNLQYLPGLENMRKHNVICPDEVGLRWDHPKCCVGCGQDKPLSAYRSLRSTVCTHCQLVTLVTMRAARVAQALHDKRKARAARIAERMQGDNLHCAGCGQWSDKSNHFRNPSTLTGYSSRCIPCMRPVWRERFACMAPEAKARRLQLKRERRALAKAPPPSTGEV